MITELEEDISTLKPESPLTIRPITETGQQDLGCFIMEVANGNGEAIYRFLHSGELEIDSQALKNMGPKESVTQNACADCEEMLREIYGAPTRTANPDKQITPAANQSPAHQKIEHRPDPEQSGTKNNLDIRSSGAEAPHKDHKQQNPENDNNPGRNTSEEADTEIHDETISKDQLGNFIHALRILNDELGGGVSAVTISLTEEPQPGNAVVYLCHNGTYYQIKSHSPAALQRARIAAKLSKS
jgi:hypothetical protein